jgi:hypothetical protein
MHLLAGIMNKIPYVPLALLAGVLFAGLMGVPQTLGAGPVYAYTESYEQSFGGWIPDHYLLCEPGCGYLDWTISRSADRAFNGFYSLKGYLNGSHDDGTLWVERPFYLSQLPKKTYSVTLSFYLWSPTATTVNTWPVVAFLAQKDPETEADFTVIGQTNQVAGWKQYNYSANIVLDPAQPLWVAYGFGATWEVSRTYYLDHVTLNVY